MKTLHENMKTVKMGCILNKKALPWFYRVILIADRVGTRSRLSSQKFGLVKMAPVTWGPTNHSKVDCILIQTCIE